MLIKDDLRKLRIFWTTILLVLLHFTSIEAADIQFTSIPSELNRDYWKNLKNNSNRMIIPLTGEWQYQLSGNDEIEGLTEIPGQSDYKGEIIFRKIITIDSRYKEKEFYIHFDGVSFRGVVRLNNEYLGTIENPYIEEEFYIPREMIFLGKENVIEVEVSGSTDFDSTLPTGTQFNLWDIHSGIFREVYLVGANSVRIEDIKTYQTFARQYQSAQIWAKTTIRRRQNIAVTNPDKSDKKFYYEMSLFQEGELVSRKQSFAFSFSESSFKEQTLSLTVNDIKPWTPDNPNLYRLRLSVYEANNNLLVDREWKNIGFYNLQIRGNQFLLNGKGIKLKGIDYTQYFPMLGDLLVLPVVEKDFLLLKKTGFNAISSFGRPLPESILNLADKLGLFVLQEFPAYFTPGSRLGDKAFLNKASNLFKKMIKSGRNHPSVFAWGIGRNFDSNSANAASYYSFLKKTASILDNRPLFMTTNLLIEDKLGYALDFIIIDAFSWNDSNDYLRRLPMVRQRYPGKPVILGGIGHVVQPANNQGSLDPLSEQGQAQFIEKNLRLSNRSNIFAGLFLHSFTDYLTENSNNFAPIINASRYMPTGIFDLQRKERPAVNAVKTIFLGESEVPVIIGNKPPSPGFWYIGAALLNLLLFGIIYKNSLRFRDNVKRSLGHPFGFFSDIRDRRIIPVAQSIWLAAFISLTGSIFYASIFFHYRFSLISGFALNTFLPEGMVKATLFKLMWNPGYAIVVFTLILFLFFTTNGLIIRILALFTRKRIVFRQCLSLSYWSATNFVILIIPALFFFIILSYAVIMQWIFLIWLFFHIWFFFRLINSTRILLDVPLFNILIVFLFLLIFTLLIYILYMQNTYNLLDYFQMFQTILAEQRW